MTNTLHPSIRRALSFAQDIVRLIEEGKPYTHLPLKAQLERAMEHVPEEVIVPPEAWAVKDWADSWIIFNSERLARAEAATMGGALCVKLTQYNEETEKDKKRMDFLCEMSIEVRTPLRHGSRENFRTSPDLEEEHSDLRNMVDVCLLNNGKYTKL